MNARPVNVINVAFGLGLLGGAAVMLADRAGLADVNADIIAPVVLVFAGVAIAIRGLTGNR